MNYKLNHSRVLDNSCTANSYYNELGYLQGIPTRNQRKYFWRLYYTLKDNGIVPKSNPDALSSRGKIAFAIDILKEQITENNINM